MSTGRGAPDDYAVLLDVGCGTGEDVRALGRRVYPFGGLLFDLR